MPKPQRMWEINQLFLFLGMLSVVFAAEICFGDRGALADRDCHRDHSFAIVSVAGAVSCAARDIVDAGVGGFRDFYGVGGGICCE